LRVAGCGLRVRPGPFVVSSGVPKGHESLLLIEAREVTVFVTSRLFCGASAGREPKSRLKDQFLAVNPTRTSSSSQLEMRGASQSGRDICSVATPGAKDMCRSLT